MIRNLFKQFKERSGGVAHLTVPSWIAAVCFGSVGILVSNICALDFVHTTVCVAFLLIVGFGFSHQPTEFLAFDPFRTIRITLVTFTALLVAVWDIELLLLATVVSMIAGAGTVIVYLIIRSAVAFVTFMGLRR